MLDDRRTDFLIYYGFIGPILIELKLSTNSDLNLKSKLENSKSFKNLAKYMVGYNANFGLLFVVDNKERDGADDGWKAHLDRIKEAYEKIDNVEVLGMQAISKL